jgi:GT2 family glycosyltransferase
MNNYPLVSIIIVNWNGGETLVSCLKSIAGLKYPNFELILVDNGSTDESLAYLTTFGEFGKRLRVIKNKTNLGFAKANNQGAGEASGDYLLLLNNDTKVDSLLLNIMVERMQKDKGLGVLQPKIKIWDRPEYLDNAGSFLTVTGFLEHWGFLRKDGDEFQKEKYIFSAKGACMLVSKNIVDKIGLFDEDFGSYFEETDFCWRVWLSGYKVLYYPATSILHKVGFSSKRQDQVLVNYHSFKNRLCSLIKNLNGFNFVKIISLHLLVLFFLSLFYAFRLKFAWSLMIIKAFGWNIKEIKNTLLKRKIIRKITVVKDKDIFKYIYKKIDFGGMLAHFIRSNKMLSGKHAV